MDKLERLLSDLNDWVTHHRHCDAFGGFEKGPVICNCGLDNVRFEIETELEKQKQKEYEQFIEEESAKYHNV